MRSIGIRRLVAIPTASRGLHVGSWTPSGTRVTRIRGLCGLHTPIAVHRNRIAIIVIRTDRGMTTGPGPCRSTSGRGQFGALRFGQWSVRLGTLGKYRKCLVRHCCGGSDGFLFLLSVVAVAMGLVVAFPFVTSRQIQGLRNCHGSYFALDGRTLLRQRRRQGCSGHCASSIFSSRHCRRHC